MDAGDDGAESSAGRIRKRRFSTARIQPTRVKKVMQSDEEIGRMVASVPVAIGSAMEHFAEKLLEAAAQCVQFSAARTLAPMHVRHAIQRTPHFAFLDELTKNILVPRDLNDAMPPPPASAPAHPQQPPVGHLAAPQFAHYPPGGHLQPAHLPPPSISAPFGHDLNANSSPQLFPSMGAPFGHPYEQPSPFYAPYTTGPPPQMMPMGMPPVYAPAPPAAAPSTAEPPATEPPAKRKRGRPRKERKDKFVESNGDQRLPPSLPTTTNGHHSAITNQELDALLMPPPGLPLRGSPVVGGGNEPTAAAAASAPNSSTSLMTA
ncbi:CBFD-NFYB-HMF domain-containing protein [Aphelenchoides fujianensis]|nr:CBFD-NFYB-HMF domain-containing protein [Aphelenchoides fujianensis]